MGAEKTQSEIEKDIDKKVDELLEEVQSLEYFVNQQVDRTQRHTDQSLIHSIVDNLNDLKTDRWQRYMM